MSSTVRDEPSPPTQHWSRPILEPECPPDWRTGPPDFVGVGAQRCGTSWWYRGALRSHPQVAHPPGRRKEVHFFDRYWTEEPADDFGERYARLFPRPAGAIAGEWTPAYMHHFWSLALLARAAPQTRILIMLRDPVQRCTSGLAWESERSRRRGQDSPDIAIVGDAVARSLYCRQVEHAFELFGRERTLVLQYERCLRDPLAEMQRTHRFLGIDPLPETTPLLRRAKRPGHRKPEPAQPFLELLRERLEDDVRRLAALCPEIDLSLWRNFA